jgi:NTP pyrophosphatase (non-canonical NTP hydrolase)
MSKLTLKEKPTLRDFQKYAQEMEKERGFEEETILEQCLLLGEEVGELFKAIRKHKTNINYDNENSQVHNIENEMADVMMYLFCLANRMDIDLERAIRNKEEINKNRTWN